MKEMGWTLCSKYLLLLALSSTVLAQDPKVKIKLTEPETFLINKQQVIYAKRDQDVSISCFVEDLAPGLTVRWRKIYYVGMDKKQVFISNDMAISDNIKYSIEKPTDYTWRLRIRDIQIWDEGDYECFVQLTGLSIAAERRYVNVFVPPYLTPSMVSPDTTKTEGQDVFLMCNGTGRPEPSIMWTRLGGALLPGGKQHHMGAMLTINNVKARDRGQYQCYVWNSIGDIRRDILLDIRFAPVVTIEREVVRQAEGYAVELRCLIEANPSPKGSDMKWVKDGLSYTVTSDRYIVTTIEGAFNRLQYEIIIDGVEEEDYGIFTCMVSNSMSATGPAQQRIRLEKAEEPQPSPKMGQPLESGFWRKRFEDKRIASATSVIMVPIATILMCLATYLLHH